MAPSSIIFDQPLIIIPFPISIKISSCTKFFQYFPHHSLPQFRHYMEENHHLLRPLLNPSTTSSAAAAPPIDHANSLKLISSNSGIIFRLTLVLFIGIVCVWANHEASKGYAITIVNEPDNTFLGKRFHLFYVSNDEATRIMIKASEIIENFLYPDYEIPAKKPIKHVILKLAHHNMTKNVVVESDKNCVFVLNINPSVMEGTNFDLNLIQTVRRGMARVLVWDGQGKAPKKLIDGIVEYLVNYLGGDSLTSPETIEPLGSTTTIASACWQEMEAKVVAEFLNYGERRRPGFIGRLNQAMKEGWNDETLSGALGLSVHDLCTDYDMVRYNSSGV